MPEDWQGVRLGAPDTRLLDRPLERTTRSSRRGPYQPLGVRVRMMRSQGWGGRAKPAAPMEAPDNTGDLKMANVESVAIHVDEEDEDIV